MTTQLKTSSKSEPRTPRTGSVTFIYRSLLVLYFIVSIGSAFAQTALPWKAGVKYDTGLQTSLAILPNGLVLEFHKAPSAFVSGDYIWYHVGKLTTNGTIEWGPSQKMPESAPQQETTGSWPTVAMTRAGQVLLVYSPYNNKKASDLRYWAGSIDPNGDTKQSVSWKAKNAYYDSGFHTSIVITDSNTIVGVHESGSSGTGLYYRIGHFKNIVAGDYDIVWDSGQNGVKYDDGINPHISINNKNQVVEVHQVTKERLVHYRRGNLKEKSIDFEVSQRYDNNSIEPAVTLLDDGTAVELHSENKVLFSRKGILHPDDSRRIDWGPSAQMSTIYYYGFYPAVTSNKTYAVTTWEDGAHVLSYSTVLLPR